MVQIVVQIVKCFQKLCSSSTDRNVLLLGYFNLPDIDWYYYHAANSAVSELLNTLCIVMA